MSAPTVVQGAGGTPVRHTATGGVPTVTLLGVTAGNTIVVVGACGAPDQGVPGASKPSAPTDGVNTYHQAENGGTQSGIALSIYYAYNVAGGDTTVSQSFAGVHCLCCGGPVSAALTAYEIAPGITTDPLDQHSTASAGNTPASITTAAAAPLVIGAITDSQSATTRTAGSGWGNLEVTTGTLFNSATDTEANGAGTYTTSFSGALVGTLNAIVSFASAAAPPPTTAAGADAVPALVAHHL